jgi:hypothetical protein
MDEFKSVWQKSPYYSSKFDAYFPVYENIFRFLVNQKPTFVEIGIQGGGSLFAWREYFGNDARIIGIDLNPKCKRFEEFGFEIFIGDAADEDFLKSTFNTIGKIDAILDDGGHLFNQQINVLQTAAKCISNNFICAIEDTTSSFYKNFLNTSIKNRTFLNYAKDLTDFLQFPFIGVYPNAISSIQKNHELHYVYNNLDSINFYKGIVAFFFNNTGIREAKLITNAKPLLVDEDFRHIGILRNKFIWPHIKKGRSYYVGERKKNLAIKIYNIFLNFIYQYSKKD